MFTPCDEDDILSGARQLCAKVPARPTCSEDHNTHCRHPEAPMESLQSEMESVLRQAEAELNPRRPKTAPGTTRTCWGGPTTSAVEGRTDMARTSPNRRF